MSVNGFKLLALSSTVLVALGQAAPSRAQKRTPSPSQLVTSPQPATTGQSATATATARGTPEFEQAVALIKQHRLKEAIVQFQEAYRRNQQVEACSISIALCYDQLGDSQRAQQYYQFVIDHWPTSEAADMAKAHMANVSAVQSMPKIWTSFQRGQQGHMFVPAAINGHGLTMMFDTGAAMCFATTSQLQRFGINLDTTASKARMLGVGGEAEAKVANVEISFCGITRTVRLYIQDDHSQNSPTGGGMENCPLLGQSFYGDFAVEIDGRAQRVALSAPQTTPVKDRDMAVPFKRESNLIIVKPKIMGRECDMILDTGASGLAFTDRQYSGFGFLRPENADRGGSMGVGGKRAGFHFYVKDIKLGPIFRDSAEASLSLDGTMPEPLLGASFLRDLHFTIEPQLKQIVFQNP